MKCGCPLSISYIGIPSYIGFPVLLFVRAQTVRADVLRRIWRMAAIYRFPFRSNELGDIEPNETQ